MTLLNINRISKSFIKDNKKNNVINRASFCVERGEFIAVVGPSGCGKSTLLSLIAGFEQYDEGDIFLNGKRITEPGTDRIMVFQDFNQLFPWKTVIQNISFPLDVNKRKGANDRLELAQYYLKMVKLEDCKNYYPHEISGGMKQRVAIARALAMEPEILLMDEPFGSLDFDTKTQLQSILMELWKEIKTTIIFVTHDVQEAIIVSDKIIVMNNSPNSIKEIIPNNLDRPRDKFSIAFKEKEKEVYSKVKE